MGGPPLLKLDAPLENANASPPSLNYTTDQDLWHEELQEAAHCQGRPTESGNLPGDQQLPGDQRPIPVFVKLVDASSPDIRRDASCSASAHNRNT
jgi:hypothetical protein